MLKLNNVEVAYLNVIRVLHGVSLSVEDGLVVALLGAMALVKPLLLRQFLAFFILRRGR